MIDQAFFSTPESLLLALSIVFMAVVLLAMLKAALARPCSEERRTIKELREQVRRLEQRVVELEGEKIELAAKAAGLKREAVRLLDAVTSGEVELRCRDGRQAMVVGGDVICVAQSEGEA